MPYADVIGNVARLTIAVPYTGDRQIQEFNTHWQVTATAGADTRNALGLYQFNQFASSYQTYLSSIIATGGYKVSMIVPSPPPFPISNWLGLAGLDTNTQMPTHARPVLGSRTAFAGRGYRGRVYLPTPCSDGLNTTTLQVSAGLLAAMTLVAAPLGNPYTTGGTTWQPVLAHRHKGPPVTWTFTPIAAFEATGLFGTQRRSGNYGRYNTIPPW